VKSRPDIRRDLARYDGRFGLPAVNLQVNTALPPGSPPFEASGEYAGDVEIVHAVAPRAAIRVILIPSNNHSVAAGVRGTGARRGVPDVSADADQDAGIVFGEVFGGRLFIAPAGGTSAAAPFWAGIVALADQYAGRHLGFINPAVYQVGRSAQYHRAFHDVTKGNNTVKSGPFTIKGFNATRGWDPATGWGSPDAHVLIPLLARYAAR